jgi:hypothetical protein
MTLPELVAASAVAISLGGIIYSAGRNAENARQSKAFADGLGKNIRDHKAIADRRWKLELATLLDQVDHPLARSVAEQLREDAHRD